MSALADLLESRHEELVERWTRAVEAELPRAHGASTAALRDHIPDYVRALVSILRDGSPVAKWASGNDACAHGRGRFAVGFDIESLVREYGLLRGCVFDLILVSVADITVQVPARERAQSLADALQRKRGAAAPRRRRLGDRDLGARGQERRHRRRRAAPDAAGLPPTASPPSTPSRTGASS